ncbi:yippee-like protein [Thamnocephalis sphaerospora]|uniref:Protein yippee-like n=1 Tax=Thamnocephalis sphaerospora TaxID=78915 RepID=A0A4P9XPB9_9FUNG|nr:yippee-like protein [Thamnocephalis sphaerospora]|eukprot:RKP07844.1 yippee-like protein [Thamnocephalis sphaerospora]
MKRIFQMYLDGDKIYACAKCHAHLALHDDIISKAFQGRHGRAILFDSVYNVTPGQKEERVLMTGRHTVADVRCTVCQTTVGWYYYRAAETAQRYKEGKYAIERARISKDHQWS